MSKFMPIKKYYTQRPRRQLYQRRNQREKKNHCNKLSNNAMTAQLFNWTTGNDRISKAQKYAMPYEGCSEHSFQLPLSRTQNVESNCMARPQEHFGSVRLRRPLHQYN